MFEPKRNGPLYGSEAKGDLVLIRPHSFCSVNQVVLLITRFIPHKSRGLYQGKATSNLAAIQTQGERAHNCKMIC